MNSIVCTRHLCAEEYTDTPGACCAIIHHPHWLPRHRLENSCARHQNPGWSAIMIFLFLLDAS